MTSNSTDVMKADQDRVRKLLSETIIMLCKSGLRFEDQLEIKGVIAITIDKEDVFIVHIDDRETHAGIKSEPSQLSPCTTSDVDNQLFNGVPIKKMKVEDNNPNYGNFTANIPNITANIPNRNIPQTRLTIPQGVSAPQFFTDDIDNQTPLKNMSSPSQAVAEQMKNPNQWALAIPGAPRVQASMQGINNAFAVQVINRPRQMMQQVPLMRPNMAMSMRPAPSPRTPQNPSGARMMMQAIPNQHFRGHQQQSPMHLRPSGSARGSRGAGRGRAKPSPRMASMEMDMMGGKQVVASKNIDGFSYGKQTVTQYICNICSVVYRSHSSLLTHQVKSHGRQKKSGVGRRPKQAGEQTYEEDEGMDDRGYGEYVEDEYDEDYLP